MGFAYWMSSAPGHHSRISAAISQRPDRAQAAEDAAWSERVADWLVTNLAARLTIGAGVPFGVAAVGGIEVASNLYPISIGLYQFLSQYGTNWPWLMAASTAATVPRCPSPKTPGVNQDDGMPSRGWWSRYSRHCPMSSMGQLSALISQSK